MNSSAAIFFSNVARRTKSLPTSGLNFYKEDIYADVEILYYTEQKSKGIRSCNFTLAD